MLWIWLLWLQLWLDMLTLVLTLLAMILWCYDPRIVLRISSFDPLVSNCLRLRDGVITSTFSASLALLLMEFFKIFLIMVNISGDDGILISMKSMVSLLSWFSNNIIIRRNTMVWILFPRLAAFSLTFVHKSRTYRSFFDRGQSRTLLKATKCVMSVWIAIVIAERFCCWKNFALIGASLDLLIKSIIKDKIAKILWMPLLLNLMSCNSIGIILNLSVLTFVYPCTLKILLISRSQVLPICSLWITTTFIITG